jgi:hypothetical protein
MSLYESLVKEKNRLSRIALRTPKTAQEVIDRKKFERVMNILWKRYEYGMEERLDEYRRQDQIEEIGQVKRF